MKKKVMEGHLRSWMVTSMGAWLMAPPQALAIPQEHGGCPEPIRHGQSLTIMAKISKSKSKTLKNEDFGSRLVHMKNKNIEIDPKSYQFESLYPPLSRK